MSLSTCLLNMVVVLDLDRQMALCTEWGIARVRAGVCDAKLIPDLDWMTYCDQAGYWSRYDIQFEVEGRIVSQDTSGGPPP